MTDRHPLDCLLTPPDAARALNEWLMRDMPTALMIQAFGAVPVLGDVPVLDPFAGAGTLLQPALRAAGVSVPA